MGADLERLLHDAAGEPRRELDLERLAATARSRRLRRRGVATLTAVVLLAAVAVLAPRAPEQQVVIDAPEGRGWPLLARYTETSEDGQSTYEWEVGARSWTSWTMVRSDLQALAREGDDRWVGSSFFLDEGERESPFDLVREVLAGLWSERYLVDAVREAEDEWQPPAWFDPMPATAEDVPGGALVARDLPAMRGAVADRLGLDAGTLVAFTMEREDGVHVTWVRDRATGLPLHYEEASAVRLEATAVRFAAELPAPRPEPGPPDPSEVTGDPATPQAAVAGRWRDLPEAPVEGRQEAGAVWTGSELLVWGGVPRAGGAAYDPDADSWRVLPDAPISPREWHVSVWTGAELVVWGGSAYEEPADPGAPLRGADLIGELRADGAAYDPDADSWRLLADSPLEARAGAAAVWTGSEVLVVAGSGAGVDPGTTRDLTDGAAYEPGTDTWRALPDLPDDGLREVGRDAVWTGEVMLVGGSRFAPGLAAAYDPAADDWLLVEGSPLAGGGGFVAWTGDEAILTDTMTSRLAAYDPEAGTWRELAAPPSVGSPDFPLQGVSFVAADGRLLALGGLRARGDPMGAWMLDPAGTSWGRLGTPPLADRAGPVVVWTGTEVLVWGGTAMATGHEAAAHGDGAAWRPG